MTLTDTNGRHLRFRDTQGRTRAGYLLANSSSIHAVQEARPPELDEGLADLREVSLLAPVQPRIVVCVGLNHSSTLGNATPPADDEPLLFLKAASSVVGPGDVIPCPAGTEAVDVAGELAVVLAHTAYRVPEHEAEGYIWGYTCANDVAVREWMGSEAQWFDSKSSDGFCPLGPWIVPPAAVHQPEIDLRINGSTVQRGSTADMVWTIPQLIARVTRNITLHRGDVILTGSPVGLAKARPGDLVEVSIAGVGTLRNQVVASRPRARCEPGPGKPSTLEGQRTC